MAKMLIYTLLFQLWIRHALMFALESPLINRAAHNAINTDPKASALIPSSNKRVASKLQMKGFGKVKAFYIL